ncbi:MAG: hypothetical protein JRG86_22005 [Deltaproteobacteria bacterium]|jgi:hypothetical protein|nr:hypothetical protein [Deltaproteobacteria bacterium]
MPGVLFVREDHGIGSYDACLIAREGIAYQRGSRRLELEMEEEFKAHLEQSLFDLSEESGIPIVRSPAACVMLVGVALVNVDLERNDSAQLLGEMTLAMEFRDSLSAQPRLRYATRNHIEKDVGGSDRRAQLRQSFDEMLARMNVASALQAAGLGDREIREGCEGMLAEIGRGAVAAGQ